MSVWLYADNGMSVWLYAGNMICQYGCMLVIWYVSMAVCC